MALIVGVHGIGHQFNGANVLAREWVPALRDGVTLSGAAAPPVDAIAMAFYGDLFRPAGKKALSEPRYGAADVNDELERELLLAWAEEAQRRGADSDAPATKAAMPRSVQAALRILSRSKFFTGIAERLLIADLKQVRTYFGDDTIRGAIRKRLEAEVGDETRVIVAHSLGSVVAYEALCAHPEWKVTTLVTLGSPLGIRNLVFDHLRPAPAGGRGQWPAGVTSWVNVADAGDVVALVKQLSTGFGTAVQDEMVSNGATAHDASPYLTAAETGRAIARGL